MTFSHAKSMLLAGIVFGVFASTSAIAEEKKKLDCSKNTSLTAVEIATCHARITEEIMKSKAFIDGTKGGELVPSQ